MAIDVEKVRAAHPGAFDRRDADETGAFLDGAGVEAGHFGLAPPWRARLVLEIAPAAAGQSDKNDRATEKPTHATGHLRTMRAIPLRTLQY